MKYIYFNKNTNHYMVSRKIKGKCYSFGTYDTLEEAIIARQYFENHNWDLSERLIFSKNSFIHYYNGKYHVNKTRNGKKTSFGVFDNYNDAKYQVILCKRFGWDVRLKPFDCMKYIRKRVSSTGRITYRIIRWTSSGEEFYGTFNNLKDAQFERDMLMLSNWNYDILESLIDESIDDDKWLNGRTITKNQYYKYPNGRIDYW